MESTTRSYRTGGSEVVADITRDAEEWVAGKGDGLLHVFVPHATAGLAPLRARKVERTLRTRFVELMHEKSHAEQRLSSRG